MNVTFQTIVETAGSKMYLDLSTGFSIGGSVHVLKKHGKGIDQWTVSSVVDSCEFKTPHGLEQSITVNDEPLTRHHAVTLKEGDVIKVLTFLGEKHFETTIVEFKL